jgi:hypothetical protein
VKTQVGVLIAGVAFAWLVVSYPAWRFAGDDGLRLSGAAALICLVPAVATFLWGRRAITGTPADRLQHAALGMLFRMGFVLAGTAVLYFGVPGFGRIDLWLWMAGFYLATLALGTVLLNHAPAVNAQPPATGVGNREAHSSAGA